jgi:hypothetical protein
MNEDVLDRIARELWAELPLPAEDLEVVLGQVRRMLKFVHSLDELPLDTVEPAPVYKAVP